MFNNTSLFRFILEVTFCAFTYETFITFFVPLMAMSLYGNTWDMNRTVFTQKFLFFFFKHLTFKKATFSLIFDRKKVRRKPLKVQKKNYCTLKWFVLKTTPAGRLCDTLSCEASSPSHVTSGRPPRSRWWWSETENTDYCCSSLVSLIWPSHSLSVDESEKLTQSSGDIDFSYKIIEKT